MAEATRTDDMQQLRAALIDVSDTEWRNSVCYYRRSFFYAALIDVSDTEWRSPLTWTQSPRSGSTH